MLRATTACTFSTSELQKVLQGSQFSALLTSKFVARHNGAPFLNISTAKNAPELRRFVYFDFGMRFAPQRRALFQQLHFQKWSGTVSSRHNAVHFLTSQLPKVVRAWRALCILTSKCALRHTAVHFFIPRPARWLCIRRFSEPTFRTSGATNHWRNTVPGDLSTFSHTCICLILTLSFF